MRINQNKYVIYSVMVGKYGEIYQPLCLDDRFDYILFSNDIPQSNIGVWQVRPFRISDDLDNKRKSRYPKVHPIDLLTQYIASLYIDANIQIVDAWVYSRFIELVDSGVPLAGVKLIATGRDCIYRHSYDMCVMRAEHDFNAIRQMHQLFKSNFPEHFGLNENNVIFWRHCDLVAKICEEWWWWIEHYSYRDQFSFMYCLWKYGAPRVFFLPESEGTGNSEHFNRYHHNDIPDVATQKWVKNGMFESLRNKCRRQPGCYDKFCEHWVKICKMPCSRLCLFLWGIMVLIPVSLKWAVRRCERMVNKQDA